MTKEELSFVSDCWNEYLAAPRSIAQRQHWDDIYNFADGVFDDTMIPADFVAFVAAKMAKETCKQLDKCKEQLAALSTKSKAKNNSVLH